MIVIMNRISLEKMFEVRRGGRRGNVASSCILACGICVEECNKIARDENEKGGRRKKGLLSLFYDITYRIYVI